jgi:hypothetical protein
VGNDFSTENNNQKTKLAIRKRVNYGPQERGGGEKGREGKYLLENQISFGLLTLQFRDDGGQKHQFFFVQKGFPETL